MLSSNVVASLSIINYQSSNFFFDANRRKHILDIGQINGALHAHVIIFYNTPNIALISCKPPSHGMRR